MRYLVVLLAALEAAALAPRSIEAVVALPIQSIAPDVAEPLDVDALLVVRNSDDFNLQLKYSRNGKPHSEVRYTNADLKGRVGHRFQLVGSGPFNKSGFDCSRAMYREADGGLTILTIYTAIRAMPSQLLERVCIDRVPFAFVRIHRLAHVVDLPLNRRGAPVEEQFMRKGLIPFHANGAWGFKKASSMKVVVPAKFESARVFQDGRSVVRHEGKVGVVDVTGAFVFRPQFDSCTDFGSRGCSGIAVSRVGDMFGLIHRDGRVLCKPKYHRIGRFDRKLARAERANRYGLLSADGRELLPPSYAAVGEFREGLAAVCRRSKWGFINVRGEFVVEQMFLNAGSFGSGLAPVKLTTGKWGYIDNKGAVRIAATFDIAEPFCDGLAVVGRQERFGFLAPNGELRIKFRFDAAKRFSDGLAAVRVDGEWGYVDPRGRLAIDYQFSSASKFKNGRATVRKSDRAYWLDHRGNLRPIR